MKYTIHKGNHYSGIRFHPHFGISKMERSVTFNEDCLYPQTNTDLMFDINKLFGFSYGYHHKNSFRFGWVPSVVRKGKIDIWAYCYINGNRITRRICDVFPGVEYKFIIEEDNSISDGPNILFIVRREMKMYFVPLGSWWERFKKPKLALGYYLYPYFGGNERAPQTINIEIK